MSSHLSVSRPIAWLFSLSAAVKYGTDWQQLRQAMQRCQRRAIGPQGLFVHCGADARNNRTFARFANPANEKNADNS
jgi:hypothetical protein